MLIFGLIWTGTVAKEKRSRLCCESKRKPCRCWTSLATAEVALARDQTAITVAMAPLIRMAGPKI